MNDGAELGGLGDAPQAPASDVGAGDKDRTVEASSGTVPSSASSGAFPSSPGQEHRAPQQDGDSGAAVNSPGPPASASEPPATSSGPPATSSGPPEPASPAPIQPAPIEPVAIEPAPTMSEVDREVEEAMAAMDDTDLAELRGGAVKNESTEPGTELTGTVVAVAGDDVFLEIGARSQAVLPKSQFGKNEKLDVGRRVDVVIERYDADSGLIIVNRQGATLRANWNTLAVGSVVGGKVTGVIKGGLEVSLSGIRAFMPASQVDVVHIKDVSLLLNENIRCEVVELDRRGKNVLVSRRRVLEKEVAETREALRKELAVGQVRKGIVKTIVEFGAFIDLGGVDGLAHIGDLSWSSVDKVTDILKAGQEVEVQILRIDDKRDRISLGLKQCQPDPWGKAPDTYPVGTALKVRVLRLADFGAFAELEAGIEGLIPISELGWSRVRSVSDVLSVGDMVDAVVIRVDEQKHRLALSIKQARPDPWAEVMESFPAKSLVKGKVTRLTDFGAFVELVPGVEGLIHISELSENRVKACSDVVSEGQEVETRVLSLDMDQRRISLSIKAVNEASPQEAKVVASKKPKKRKKPLRGGLSSHFDW